jgi:hypothetical protein
MLEGYENCKRIRDFASAIFVLYFYEVFTSYSSKFL